MENFSYKIKNGQGIGARPAGMIVGYARMFSSDIKINCMGREADAKRLLSLMALGAKEGDVINVSVSGEDEKEAGAAFSDFCGRVM